MRLYNKNKETIDNFIWRAIQIVSGQGAMLLVFLLCAKFLNVYEFGIYNYVLAALMFLIMFGDFGISSATSKFVTEYHLKEKESIGKIVFGSVLVILGLGVILFSIVFIFGKGLLQENYNYILLALPLICLIPLCSIYDGVYRGLKQFKKLATISFAGGTLSIIIAYILTSQYGLKGALVSQVISYTIQLILLIFCFGAITYTLDRGAVKKVIKYSIIIGFANLGMYLYTRFDVIALGIFGYMNEISYYEFASRIFLILAVPFTIFSEVIAPDIIRLNVHGKYNEINRRLKRYFVQSLIVGFCIALISVIIVYPLTVHFYPQYDSELYKIFFYVFMFILPIRVFGTVLATSFIVPVGDASIITYNNIIFGLLNALFDLIFIKYLGPGGVIISTFLFGYISVIVAYRQFNKKWLRK